MTHIQLESVTHIYIYSKCGHNKIFNVVHLAGKGKKPTDYNFLFDNNILKGS